jgi:enediyne biosynthesis protein E4
MPHTSSLIPNRPTGHPDGAVAARRNPCGPSLPGLLLAGLFTIGSIVGLTWESHDGYRSAPITVAAEPAVGFTRLPPSRTGILFTNLLSDLRSVTNRNLLSGAGVAAGDIDGDGLVDLYFCGLDSDNRLYRNLGNWRFEDITAQAGVACPGQDSTAAAFADINGNGHLDLIVNSLGGGTRIFQNDGVGRFTETTARAGVATNTGAMSLALADVNGNGALDLYVANFRLDTIRDRPTARLQVQMINQQPVIVSVDGRPTTAPDLTNRFALSPGGEILEFGEPDVLYLNDGTGRFTPMSFTGGAFLDEEGKPLSEAPQDWGLSVRFYDFTGNGAPDIYVCNDLQTPDRIWLNDGRGRFRAIPQLAIRHTSTFSMGIDFADLNRNGHVDFYNVDMVSREARNRKIQIAGLTPVFYAVGEVDIRPQIFMNTLQINRGDNTFAEVAYYSGLEATEWSWHPVFLDVDLNGYEDILVPNGQLRDFQNADIGRVIESAVTSRRVSSADLVTMFRQFPGLNLPNLLFRNLGDLVFEEVSADWGFDSAGISQGMALADLDNDGDLDLIINNLNGPPGIYRNITTAPRVAVRLQGRAPNTQGIGAHIKVLGGPVVQSQEMVSAGRFLSADDAMRVFAAGHLTNRLTLEVTWRSGQRSVVADAVPNRIYEISEESARPVAPDPKPEFNPWFEDVSRLVQHAHIEEPYDDFSAQFLLPNMLSHLGPGITWADLNHNGYDDLVIGTGRGGVLGVYLNDRQGGFQRVAQPPFNALAPRDTTSVLPLALGPAKTVLLAGSSNHEDGNERGAVVRIFDPQVRTPIERFPGQVGSTGPLALADVNGNGQLDLFVGGRSIPGRYPEPASSFLFLNRDGSFEIDAENLATFAHVGLVSGAVFSDLDGDGQPDLILACEWGPIRVFRNDRGRFIEITESLGLDQYTGWWNGVATADLNGNGRPDIIASNWGLNTRYRASHEHPRRIYYGDFTENGVVDLVETLYDEILQQEVPDRDLNVMSLTLPFIREKFPTHEAYAGASVAEVLGEHYERAQQVSANTLASMVFLNHGDRFEPKPLPPEAQFSPAFAVVVADFLGNGHEDVFLSQNFFTVQPFTMRNDAGRGLLLQGDGSGNLAPIQGHLSGILVYGDQRGAAAADFDADGRVDLAVSQNANQTRLFRNTQAQPGLRIRLQGPPGNPHAVGASIRLRSGSDLGPAREVQSGSGYWSQNSPVQVMTAPGTPTAIVVRWPGGPSTTSELPPEAREIRVEPSGQVTVLR